MLLTAISPGIVETSSQKWKLVEEGMIILHASSLTNTMSLSVISPGTGDTSSQNWKMVEAGITLLLLVVWLIQCS